MFKLMDFKKAIRLLKEQNYKITKPRRDMLKFLEKEDRYIAAKDVMSYMKKEHPSISIDTVYRNLHLYHSLNILEATSLKGEKHFRFNCSMKHHHHFICQDCGSTKKLPHCPLDDVLQLLTGYAIEDHKFEVYGLCPNCQFVS